MDWCLQDMEHADSPESCTELLQEAYQISISQKGKNNNRKPYWWNQQIVSKRCQCNQMRRDISRAVSQRNIPEEEKAQLINNYKTEKRTLQKLIKTSKREHWKKL
ncbi:hypothetical protein JTB14_020514 [Gonioctena quinquepunctata]|nr:hypothetical protein JTB14_020514 [Gonioctena quinquepunctata]